MPVADPKNSLGVGVAIIWSPTSSNGTLREFVIDIAKFYCCLYVSFVVDVVLVLLLLLFFVVLLFLFFGALYVFNSYMYCCFWFLVDVVVAALVVSLSKYVCLLVIFAFVCC